MANSSVFVRSDDLKVLVHVPAREQYLRGVESAQIRPGRPEEEASFICDWTVVTNACQQMGRTHQAA